MRNGEWGMGNGKQGMENREWGMSNGKQEIKIGGKSSAQRSFGVDPTTIFR